MKRHSVGRMLAMMESCGSITAQMRRAGLELHYVMITSGAGSVLVLLGLLGLRSALAPSRSWAAGSHCGNGRGKAGAAGR